MSGQITLARFGKVQIKFFTRNLDQTPPSSPLIYPGIIFLGSRSIVTVFKGAICRKQNTRRDGDEENSGFGKSKTSHKIFGYGRFFHGKLETNTRPGGPHERMICN